MAQELTTEVEQVRRMAGLLSDATSQDLLQKYLRDVEYDVVYRHDEDEKRVTI